MGQSRALGRVLRADPSSWNGVRPAGASQLSESDYSAVPAGSEQLAFSRVPGRATTLLLARGLGGDLDSDVGRARTGRLSFAGLYSGAQDYVDWHFLCIVDVAVREFWGQRSNVLDTLDH